MSVYSFQHPIIGQEAICPQGLGRVVSYRDDFPHQWICVRPYIGGCECNYDYSSVQLIPPNMAISQLLNEVQERLRKHLDTKTRWEQSELHALIDSVLLDLV